jgi:uncharacterized repeat protein (TIGR03803 family)
MRQTGSFQAGSEPVLGRKPVLALFMRMLWAAVLLLSALGASAGVVMTTLYTFTNVNDGRWPDSPLVQGSDGCFYGTTAAGGTYPFGDGCGTIFKISTNGAFTSFYSFGSVMDTNGHALDGAGPDGGLVQGSDGNFYGTTYSGGTNDYGGEIGLGNVFGITPDGALTSLYSFGTVTNANGDPLDGAEPIAGMVEGSDGNFYGTTSWGGTNLNYGTVFKITPDGALTTLYSFGTVTNSDGIALDGEYPRAALVQGSDGNFYGTTYYGGTYGGGTVFKITRNGELTSLHSFTSTNDGAAPNGPLVEGIDGNFYGTTSTGGSNGFGYGTVFKISTNGAFTSLYTFTDAFTDGSDGGDPQGSLVLGSDGNFYGTTGTGGFNDTGYGTVFKISPDGAFTSLYTFTNGNDGAYPDAGLVQGSDGNFYGTTYGEFAGGEGANFGTVFRLTVMNSTPLTITSGLTVNPVTYGTLSGLDKASLSSNNVVLEGVAAQDIGSVYLNTNGYTAVFTDINANPAVPVTVSGLSLSGSQATNYTLVQPSLTGAINPAPLTYVATARSQLYGSANTNFTGTLTGFVYSDSQSSATTGTLAFTSATAASSPVGTYAISGSGLSASNYTFAQAAGNATALRITPATLTYMATAASQPYGSANTNFTGTVTGFVAGDTQSSATTGTLAFTSTTTATSPVGSYAITGSGLSATNYTFVQAGSNATALTITAGAVTIVSGLTADNKTYDGTNTATLSLSNTVVLAGLASGDVGSVTLSTNGYVATFANSNATTNITVTVAGLTLTGGDYTNYTLTQPVFSADITPAPVTITSGLTVNPLLYGTLSGLDEASLSSNNVVLAGIVAQDIGSVYLDTNGYTAVFTDTNANPAVPVTVAGLSLGGSQATNYSLIEPLLTGAINPATLTYVAKAASQLYGSANTNFTGTVTGFVYGDTQSNATSGTLTFTSMTTAASPPGSYAINGSGLTASNYVFQQAADNATALTIISTTPTSLSLNLSANQLIISWPADHLGWRLQTNSIDISIAADWFDYPGSTTNTSETITIGLSQTNVFFRLVDQ